MKKLNTSEFIDRSNNVHNGKYSYLETEYKTAKANVKILCNIHGIFEQMPFQHMAGSGCQSCGIESRSSKRLLRNIITLKLNTSLHKKK
jgi:hypothetical protein